MNGRPVQTSVKTRVRNGAAPRARQRGFNFAEVLFAVMILGIGFIMVAAIFPVALLQTKTTQEETAAAGIARGGANYLEQIATDTPTPILPATGNQVMSLDRVPAVVGALPVAADARYAWVPFYRRIGTPDTSPPIQPGPDWAPYAQVYMLPIAVRTRSIYDRGVPDTIDSIASFGTGIGTAVLVASVVDSTSNSPMNPDAVDYIEFTQGRGANDTDGNYTAVAPGAYVIIAGWPAQAMVAKTASGEAARIGHIFRIGNPTPTQPTAGYTRRWELMPANDYAPLKGDWNNDGDYLDAGEDPGPLALADAQVFVVGRSLLDPAQPYDAANNPRDAAGQDVAAYTTFINIR